MTKSSRFRRRQEVKKFPSFGSVLDEIGFKPLGRRVRIKASGTRPPLRVRPARPNIGPQNE